MIHFKILSSFEAQEAICLDECHSFFTHLTLKDIEIRLLKHFNDDELETAMNEYMTFVKKQVIDFEQTDYIRLMKCEKEINEMLKVLNISITPPNIHFIKTTGSEEGNAGYTRDNCIIIPSNKFQKEDFQFLQFICHEIFHVFSRYNPLVREKFYKLLNFFPLPGLSLDKDLMSNRITNPDASNYKYGIELFDNHIYVPFVFSKQFNSNLKEGVNMFNFIDFAYFKVENNQIVHNKYERIERINGLYEINLEKKPRVDASTHILYDKISLNTGYIIHPEEIMADNFSLLLLSSKYPNIKEGIDDKGDYLQKAIYEILEIK